MENSISLGLLHGLVYGIVPVAPWFVALKRYLLEGKEKGLSEEFVLKMFKAIHQESINHQENIIKG